MLSVLRKLFHPLAIILIAGTLFLASAVFLISSVNKKGAICRKCNIVVIDIDSLRADELPCFGYYRNTAPNICRLAAAGVTFENHFSQSSWTMPNLFSFLTSLNPEVHNLKRFLGDSLDTKIKSLVEDLKEEGYATAWVGYSESWTISKENNGTTGFSLIYPNSQNSDQWLSIIDVLHKSYETDKIPFFIYFYNADFHFPYKVASRKSHEWMREIPEDFPATSPEINETVRSYVEKNFSTIFPKEAVTALPETFQDYSNIDMEKLKQLYGDIISSNYGSIEDRINMLSRLNLINTWGTIHDAYVENVNRLATQKYGDDVVKYARTVYDVKLNQIDQDLTKFIDQLLDDKDYTSDTIVIFLSDHGEEFMEHGGFMHSTLYNELLRIPLIIKVPGILPGRVKGLTQTIDVFPTLLDLVGVRTPESAQGDSLLELMLNRRDKNMEDRYVVSSTEDSAAIQNERWKLIEKYSAAATDRKLYHLADDPKEKENVAGKFPEMEAILSRKLKEARDGYAQTGNR